MKNLIYAALFSIICTSSFAQKCKETTDAITNEKKYEFVYNDAWHSFQYESKNGNITLTKQFYYTGAMNIIAPAGLEIYFKLENGEVIKTKTTKETAPKMYGGVAIMTGYNFTMNLTKDDLNKLAVSPIILIRVPKITEDGFYDLGKKDFHVKRNKKALMKGAACMGSF